MHKEVSQNYVNITQAARLINVHPATVRRWMDDQKIEFSQESYKKYLIPIKEVLRLQDERGISAILNTDGTIDFRHLHNYQQVDLLASQIDFLQSLTEKERLEKELKKRQEAVRIAEQALRRLEEAQEEQKRVFQWPNKYMNYTINDIPNVSKNKRYKNLVLCELLET